jgi:hypothetical protein
MKNERAYEQEDKKRQKNPKPQRSNFFEQVYQRAVVHFIKCGWLLIIALEYFGTSYEV